MQGKLDITGAGCEYDFTWLYTVLWKPSILFLFIERIQHCTGLQHDFLK